MNKLRIHFRTCYHFLLLHVAITLASFILLPLNIISNKMLQVSTSGLTLYLNLYVNMGYIKYAFIHREERFRRTIIAAAGLSALQSLLVVLSVVVSFDSRPYLICSGCMMGLSCLLFSYAFGLIRDEMAVCSVLSRLNLYLPLIALAGLVFYMTGATSFLLFFPLMAAGLVVIILLWYWEIRLFRQLAATYQDVLT